MSILSSVGGVGFLIYNLCEYISQNQLSYVINFNGNYIFFSIGFWIALFLFVICFLRAITIKKKVSVNQPQFSTNSQMGGIPTVQFNGKEYLTIDDENGFLQTAYKGVTSAQHGLGIFYITQKNDMDKALYWFCVAEYNGETQATSDLNYILSNYSNPAWLNERIAYYRGEVNKNPVYKETFDDILNEMLNDPNFKK